MPEVRYSISESLRAKRGFETTFSEEMKVSGHTPECKCLVHDSETSNINYALNRSLQSESALLDVFSVTKEPINEPESGDDTERQVQKRAQSVSAERITSFI